MRQVSRREVRDWSVASWWSKEREREGNGSFDEDSNGEREEKKILKEKREEESGGKEIRVLAKVKRD